MPVDKFDDTLTLTLPINPADFLTDTVYRMTVVDLDQQSPYRDDMPWFIFFRCDAPIEQVLVPRSASLRVRPVVRGKLLFDKAIRYRHYKDFSANIHYREFCCEVEVNPALVCFEVEEKRRLGKEYRPTFTITLTSEGKEIHKETARLLNEKRSRLAVFTPFPGEVKHLVGENGVVTATLEVFNRIIARFDFSIKTTEEWEYVFADKAK